jgi:hypothetical protein
VGEAIKSQSSGHLTQWSPFFFFFSLFFFSFLPSTDSLPTHLVFLTDFARPTLSYLYSFTKRPQVACKNAKGEIHSYSFKEARQVKRKQPRPSSPLKAGMGSHERPVAFESLSGGSTWWHRYLMATPVCSALAFLPMSSPSRRLNMHMYTAEQRH